MGSSPAAYVAGLDATITQYDKRSEQVATLLPFQQLTSTTTATVSATSAYDAFGDVVSMTSALGEQTNYAYNSLGDLTSTTLTSINYTDQTGLIHTGAAATAYDYYDLSGRQVGASDNDGNLTTYLLLAGTGYNGGAALQTEVFQPDDGQIVNGYDAFGDLTWITNQLQEVETRTYDNMGRLVTDTHPADTTNSDAALTDYYAYDGLGQRIITTNSELSPGVRLTNYTSAGLTGHRRRSGNHRLRQPGPDHQIRRLPRITPPPTATPGTAR